MRRDSLHQQCIQLYKELLQETCGCERMATGEATWIEWGHKHTIQSWFRIKRMGKGYRLVSGEEESCLLNSLQSNFAGWVNFLHYYIDPLVAAG